MAERDHADALSTIIDALRASEGVIAIGAYGSTAQRRWTFASDIDLLVVLDAEPAVESVRLRVRGVPVDLNLRSADDGEHGIGGAGFVPATEPVWDPANVLARARTTARRGAPSMTRMTRYLLAHLLDKTRQLESTPLLARVFASGEGVNIVRAYYHARGRPLEGPLPALRGLEAEAPELLALMAAIATGPDLPSTYFEQAAELALAPVGGLWRDHQAFVVAWTPDERDADGERWVRERLGAVLDAAGEQRELV